MSRTTTPASTPQVEWKMCTMTPVHMKSPQALIKNQTQKSFFQPSQAQVVLNMFMPYIEGPKMDWTVNDHVYHSLFKWHLKCENILQCELPMLPEKRQCKKVNPWSGDLGIDQYVSWRLSSEELILDTIWEKLKSSARPNPMK